MKIKSITCQISPKDENRWGIENCQLHPTFNLVVGKNASGKSRFLNVLNNLAFFISGRARFFPDTSWKIIGENIDKKKLEYSIATNSNIVSSEKFVSSHNNQDLVLLQRTETGEGEIWAEELQHNIKFKIAPQEVASLKKYDTIQHPFLSEIYQWAKNLIIYRFANDFNQNDVILPIPIPNMFQEENITHVIELFKRGKNLSKDFIEKVRQDMLSLGYSIDKIEIKKADFINISPPLAMPPQSLYVTEHDLEFPIPQYQISQGMFRALSLIIHLNFLSFLPSSEETCILIDDIGEGLDFDRASKLVQLIMEKSQKNPHLQLIITSNDRFVMNKIPLEHWIIWERTPHGSKFYSKNTSSEIFQEFELTGLNNFDFFMSEFFKG